MIPRSRSDPDTAGGSGSRRPAARATSPAAGGGTCPGTRDGSPRSSARWSGCGTGARRRRRDRRNRAAAPLRNHAPAARPCASTPGSAARPSESDEEVGLAEAADRQHAAGRRRLDARGVEVGRRRRPHAPAPGRSRCACARTCGDTARTPSRASASRLARRCWICSSSCVIRVWGCRGAGVCARRRARR